MDDNGTVDIEQSIRRSIQGLSREEAGRVLPILNDLFKQSTISDSLHMVLERAVEVIGDREKAYRWFSRPVRALRYATPISMLNSPDGVQQVLTVLGRLEHGVIYATSVVSLGVLEVLVHYDEIPNDYGLSEIIIPDDLDYESLEPKAVGWDFVYHGALPRGTVKGEASQSIGDAWVVEKRSAVAEVPSFIIGSAFPSERNYLLNPEHPDFSRITFRHRGFFRFDPRLK